MCWAIESMLRREGYATATALQGARALELCALHQYALILVDAKLPDLDGVGLIALLRQRIPDAYIILVSGFLDREDALVVEGLRRRCFDRFMAKPFDLCEVRTIAHALCGESHSV